VRFAARTKVFFVPSLMDMTGEEIASAYTTADAERLASQADIRKNIRAMRRTRPGKRQSDGEDDICSRGLEHMQSMESLAQRKASKVSVLAGVLDEQDRQWDAGVRGVDIDVESIAAASALHSKSAGDMAYELGMSDAAFARRFNPAGTILSRRRSSSLEDALDMASRISLHEEGENVDNVMPSIAQTSLIRSNSLEEERPKRIGSLSLKGVGRRMSFDAKMELTSNKIRAYAA